MPVSVSTSDKQVRMHLFRIVSNLGVGETYTTQTKHTERDRVWLSNTLPREFGKSRKYSTRFLDNQKLTVIRIA